jgi:hypothetical protein
MLHRTLRCQKARKKRYGGRERRGTIPSQQWNAFKAALRQIGFDAVIDLQRA